MSETSTTAPAFACRCIGCRRRPVEWFQGMSDWHIFDKVAQGGGFYFAPDTRRFFRARVLGHRVISAGGGAHGVIVTESKAAGWDDSAGREYVANAWCRYGAMVTLLGDYGSEPSAPVVGRTVRASRSDSVRRFLFSDAAEVWARATIDGCPCHGCQIDRAEVTA